MVKSTRKNADAQKASLPDKEKKEKKLKGTRKKLLSDKVKKRQSELEIATASLLKDVKKQKQNDKLDFSSVRSAFAVFRKEKDRSPNVTAPSIHSKKKFKSDSARPENLPVSDTTESATQEINQHELDIPHSKTSLMNDNSIDASYSTNNDTIADESSDDADTSSHGDVTETLLESPQQDSGAGEQSSANGDEMSESSQNQQHIEANEQNEEIKSGMDFQDYSESFLNFKNLIKAQRVDALPKVVIASLNESGDEAVIGFNEDIKLYGSALIRVIKGTVTVLGSLLSPNKSDVTFCAPLYDPAIMLKVNGVGDHETNTVLEQSAVQEILKTADSAGVKDIQNLLECSTVVHLSKSQDSYVFTKYQNFFAAPPENMMWKELCNGCYLVGSKSVLTDFPGYHIACEEIIPQMNALNEPSNWKNSTIVTVGSKGAGKSTFNRYLVNSLLNHHDVVNYIDCDIGQPEFTIPGCVSVTHVTSPILGPPFTHLKQPNFSVYYGAITASYDVDRYIECVTNAMLHVKPGYPTVVNTMGWIKNIGMNLLVDILRLTQPAYVVQLSSRQEFRESPLITRDYVDEFESLTRCSAPEVPDYKHYWIKTDLVISSLATANPTDRRMLRILSYFNQIQRECSLRDFNRDETLTLQSLCSLRPYAVFLKDVLTCVCHETGVLRRYALSVLNCSIVSLSTVSKKDFDAHSGKKYLEPPPTSKSLGFGIVRGVNPSTKALYVISSLPREVLLRVNCLCVGSITIPDVLYNTDEAKSMNISAAPYIVDDFPFHITGSNKFRSYKIFK